jgi:hypothetical protein
MKVQVEIGDRIRTVEVRPQQCRVRRGPEV